MLIDWKVWLQRLIQKIDVKDWLKMLTKKVKLVKSQVINNIWTWTYIKLSWLGEIYNIIYYKTYDIIIVFSIR